MPWFENLTLIFLKPVRCARDVSQQGVVRFVLSRGARSPPPLYVMAFVDDRLRL